jgi:sulfate transport system permease protein
MSRTPHGLTRFSIIGIAVLYLAIFLLVPLGAVFAKAFEKGLGAYAEALRDPEALSAIRLTLFAAVIAVALNLAPPGQGPPCEPGGGARARRPGHRPG